MLLDNLKGCIGFSLLIFPLKCKWLAQCRSLLWMKNGHRGVKYITVELYVFTHSPLLWPECDTRSICKWSTAGFPSPWLVARPRLKSPVCLTIYSQLRKKGGKDGFIPFLRVLMPNSLIQDFELGLPILFYPSITITPCVLYR